MTFRLVVTSALALLLGTAWIMAQSPPLPVEIDAAPIPSSVGRPRSFSGRTCARLS